MKVSVDWLKELVDLRVSLEELVRLLPLRTIGFKEITDNYIELDMKGYNRADLLSMRGVAMEVAAITNSILKFDPRLAGPERAAYAVDEARVKVDSLDLCPVYCIAKIENLKVGQSNDSWVKKLSDCGIRSINNVADVTNLIMMEYGQPMHAFDAAKVKDETLIVRTAKSGETITTLDGKVRKLEDYDLLITDFQKALGIAGVMGGQNSEVTNSTTTILLEAAIFDPVNIRKTATRLGLPSEASKRFQHGLTKKRLLQALGAAIKMYEGLGGKFAALSIVGDLTDSVKKVKLTQKKLNSLVGVEFTSNQVEEYLTKLGFTLASQGDALRAWEVIVPYWRLDIDIEEDLIEEVARMYGYEKIPAKELTGKLPEKIDQGLPNFIYDLKKALSDTGLTEVQTYSFYSSKTINDLRLTINDLVKVANPISSETEYLRADLWPNLLEVVGKNTRQGYKDIAIFEVGKVYLPRLARFAERASGKAGLPKKGVLPQEPYRLAIALMNGTDNPTQELYQIYQGVKLAHLQAFGSEAAQVFDSEVSQTRGARRGVQIQQQNTQNGLNYFHPKRFVALELNGKLVGWIAEVHPRFLNKFGIEQRVAVLEINLTELL